MAQSCMDDARPFPATSVGHVPAHLGLTWSYMAWARQGVPAPCHADSPGSWHTVYWLLKEQQENMQHLSWAAFLFIYLLENQSYRREEWESAGSLPRPAGSGTPAASPVMPQSHPPRHLLQGSPWLTGIRFSLILNQLFKKEKTRACWNVGLLFWGLSTSSLSPQDTNLLMLEKQSRRVTLRDPPSHLPKK